MNADSPLADGPAQMIAAWRLANRLTQVTLGGILGTTAEAVAAWEEGRDTPAPAMTARLRDVMNPMADHAFVRARERLDRRSDMAALFDLDGIRLITSSKAVRQVWPQFATQCGVALNDHLVSTAATLLHNNEFLRASRKGEIAVVTGVSDRHVALGTDPCFRHKWTGSLRPYGQRMVLDVSFTPCDANTPLGIRRVLSVHDL